MQIDAARFFKACRHLGLGLSLVGGVVSGAWAAQCNGLLLHAHRGAPDAPENSRSAVSAALAGGWDGVEIDIQQLSDGAWVLHHDLQLGRTTSLGGRTARDTPSSAWREVRLKDRSSKRITSEMAPFLADVLAVAEGQPDKVFNVEIKQTDFNCNAARSAVSVLHSALPAGNWFMTAIDRSQLLCIRGADPKGYVGEIVLDPKAMAQQKGWGGVSSRLKPKILDMSWLKKLQQEVGAPVGVHVDARTLLANPTLLENAQSLGMPVFTYSLGNDQEHATALRQYARRSGMLPSGAVIDTTAERFCAMLSSL